MYKEEHYNDIIALFRVGDDILREHGRAGYAGIKMLEPIGMGELHKRARKSRPLLPDFTKFAEHMSK